MIPSEKQDFNRWIHTELKMDTFHDVLMKEQGTYGQMPRPDTDRLFVECDGY